MARFANLSLLALVLGGVACGEQTFHCEQDAECMIGVEPGVCIPPGHCAFDDPTCPSGLRYGELASAHVAGQCVVPVAGGTTAAGTSTGTGSGAVNTTDGAADISTSGTSPADPETTSGGAACPAGSPCVADDPCATTGMCDANGACVATAFVTCDDPPGPCFEPTGTCDATGTCTYDPLVTDTPCTDGDDCTDGDACDGQGQCVPGPLCPPREPCQVSRCNAGACEYASACPDDTPCMTYSCVAGACEGDPMPDGTACGDVPAERCCGGVCRDISTDVAHCGGCNSACAPGLECEPVDETPDCSSAPEETSGRCRCQMSNAQCPLGQICRTFMPYNDRCAPPDDSNCDGIAFPQGGCPAYCTY